MSTKTTVHVTKYTVNVIKTARALTRPPVFPSVRQQTKTRVLKHTNTLSIFELQTIWKHDGVSMPILEISPGQDLWAELGKTNWQK